MLWAIDVGNTHTVVGLHDGTDWRATWRVTTRGTGTEDELAATLRTLCAGAGLPFAADGMVVASVVPSVDESWTRLAREHLAVDPRFLRTGAEVGLAVRYEPPNAVGADRIANALAALQTTPPPFVVVDFGTATTFDVVGPDGAYEGGSILPGPLVSMEALFSRTAKLPQIRLAPPERAIGRTTVEALQSGIVLGYAGAIDALARRIRDELGGSAPILVTGGLGSEFMELCVELDRYEPNLTLDGLRLAYRRWTA